MVLCAPQRTKKGTHSDRVVVDWLLLHSEAYAATSGTIKETTSNNSLGTPEGH